MFSSKKNLGFCTVVTITVLGFVSIPCRVEGLKINEVDIGGSGSKNKVEVKGTETVDKVDKGVEDKEQGDGKRFPKFGFNLPLPTIPGLIPGSSSTSSTTGFPDPDPTSSTKFGTEGLGLTSTAILVKSGILGGLTAIKAAILPPIFIGSIIVFLIAGAVFFTCNVINCGFGSGGGGGGLTSGFGGLPSFPNIFNRNGYDYYEQQVQPVYQSLDESYKKYGSS